MIHEWIIILSIIMLRSSVNCWKLSKFNLNIVIPTTKKHRLTSHRLLGSTSALYSTTNNININNEKIDDKTIYELRKRLEEAPQQPGVYMFHDESGKLLYVGKSVNLKQRLKSYFKNLPSIDELTYMENNNKDNDFDKITNFEPASSLGRRQSAMVKKQFF